MTREAARSALARELRSLWGEERSRFGDRALAWLAVAPAWPEPVAKRCSFPGDLAVIGPDLERAGLAQRGEVLGLGGEEETHWWMPAAARRQTVDAMRDLDGGVGLVDTAAEVARSMLSAREDLPRALERWAELAQDRWRAHRRLHEEVTSLVASGETGEALAWVEAARFAAGVLGGALVTATELAERRIELTYRREHDTKLLARFLPREEQVRWVRELLEGTDDERWALHLLGAGGVGKTMLLRHVTAQLAPERGLVAVRIDFDHLSPDYPVRRPGQLIAALAAELSLHVTEQRQAFLFERHDEELTTLDEALSAALPPADPLANVHKPELERVLDVFAEIVRGLPQPVLLVLDTCEELAKLAIARGDSPAGARAAPPAVEATFHLLERLHARVPSVRVLFAGRRFLASKGLGWEALRQDPDGAAALPERPYLALEELRGFDEAEADALLGRVFHLGLDPDRRRAVLDQSREVTPSRVGRIDRPEAPEVSRYHPFDLALFAGWLEADPDVQPAALAGGADAYVELRILGRMESARVRAAVPALVLLRRFDRAMAAAALGRPGEGEGAIGDVLRVIAAQEWIDVQPDDESKGVFYELQRALWPRLARFYASSARRGEMDAAKRRVGPALDELARATPAAKLRAEHVEAALRALAPAAGAALWAVIEERAAREAAFERVRSIAERLLADDGAAGELHGRLRPHVLATYAAVRARLEPELEISDLQVFTWAEIEATTTNSSEDGAAAWLLTRAIVGRALALRGRADIPPRLVEEILRRVEADAAAAITEGDGLQAFRLSTARAGLASALDVVLDAARVDRAVLPPGHGTAEVIARWAEALSKAGAPIDLVALASTLAARAAAIDRRWEIADPLFVRAIDRAERADASPRAPVLELRAPASFAVRARLEQASFSVFADVGLVPDATEPDPTGERGRLAAHRILCELARGENMTAGAVAPRTLEADVSMPVSEAARRVPPLFIARARAAAVAGHVDVAIEELDQAIQAGLKDGRAAHVVASAEREKLRILRRYRVPPGELVERLGAPRRAHPDDLRDAWAYLGLMGTPPPPRSVAPTFLHELWRSTPAWRRMNASRERLLSVVELSSATSWRRTHAPQLDRWLSDLESEAEVVAPKNPMRQAALLLDVLEVRELLVQEDASPGSEAGGRDRFDPAWREDREHVDAVARLVLRTAALGAGSLAHALAGTLVPDRDLTLRAPEHGVRGAWRFGEDWALWLSHLPRRFVAEIALEEGELLALRLPDRAATLLAIACGVFQRVGDPLGALFASTLRLGAEARAGRGLPSLRHVWSSDVRPAYETCRAALGLPSLVDLARTDPGAEMPIEPPPPELWRGWFERIGLWAARIEKGMVAPRFSVRSAASLELQWVEAIPALDDRMDRPQFDVPAHVQAAPSGWGHSPPAQSGPATGGFGLRPADPVAREENVLFSLTAVGGSAASSHEESMESSEPSESVKLSKASPSPSGPVQLPAPVQPPKPPEPPASSRRSWVPSVAPKDAPTASSPLHEAAAGSGAGARLAVALGLLGVAALIVIVVMVRPLPGPAPTAGDFWAFGGAVAAVLVLALGYVLYRRWRRDRDIGSRIEHPTPRAAPASVWIRIASADEGVRLEITLDQRCRTFTLPLPAETDTYGRIANRVPAELDEMLVEGDLRGAPVQPPILSDVTFEVMQVEIAGFPWEALLARRGGLISPERSVARRRPGSELRPWKGSTVLVAGPRWSSLAAEALRAAKPRVVSVKESKTIDHSEGAVVVIGRPQLASGRVVFHVATDDVPEKATKASSPTRQGSLLVADDDGLLSAPIVVLVTEPVESYARSDIDRLRASNLRMIAHSVARRAGVVLTVPALPSSVTRDVLGAVAMWFENGAPPTSRAPLDVAKAIRAIIRAHAEHHGDTLAEAALDVVVYVGEPRPHQGAEPKPLESDGLDKEKP